MHYRELEKSKSFGNWVEWEIFSNYLSYKAHQFQRLLLAMQHLQTVKFGLRGERVPRAEIFVRFSTRAFTRFV